MLEYIVKGKSSLQGKPKVYYTAHPEDHLSYFEEVINDILPECISCQDDKALRENLMKVLIWPGHILTWAIFIGNGIRSN